MKVVSSQQMARLESLAYKDGFSEEDFMEEAGSGVALVAHDFVEEYGFDRHVILLCGKGNNAGDAYVAGIHLLHLDYHVEAYQLVPLNTCSSLCQRNSQRFIHDGGTIHEIQIADQITWPINGIIIDGIFGTGFKGEVEDPFATVIEHANFTGLPVIAVDIPSGLDGETGAANGPVIMAQETAFLGLPKTGFFLNEGWDHVGKLRAVDFGLPEEYIDQAEADLIMLSPEKVIGFLPPIKRSRHKYQAGHVIGLAGSPGMPGAAILAGMSALKGGAGIARILHPNGMQAELAASPPELIKVAYEFSERQDILDMLNIATAIFLGPGIGRDEPIRKLLKFLLPKLEKPMVIDADALTLMAEDKLPVPKNAILTPHVGEMGRLLNIDTPKHITMDFLKLCQKYAQTHEIVLILKGGPSYIFNGEDTIKVNPTGDPGMATAGAGDVLTGLLTALLAQGLAPSAAAQLGVYLHGLAGEHAAQELTAYCMTASDILECFPMAFAFSPV